MFASRTEQVHEATPQVRLLEVQIPTATAIVLNSNNPDLFLVGHSQKHALPVLPGGKIDTKDLVSSSLEVAATNCIIRELFEEIGVTVSTVHLFDVLSNSERDKRVIRAGSLRGTLAENSVQHLSDQELVLGRYGVPDYVFVVGVDPQRIVETEELTRLTWMNLRSTDAGSLAAGHEDLVKAYLARQKCY